MSNDEFASLIERLAAAGTPPGLVGEVAAALATARMSASVSADSADTLADRRRKDAERKRFSRARVLGPSTDTPDTPSPSPAPSPEKETPPPAPPLKKNKPQPVSPTLFDAGEARDRPSFDAFWAAYPHKVGKADASKAFDRAAKRVGHSTMMVGLERYIAKTDDRPWCNPATWLNQDRWADEPANSPSRSAAPRMTRVQQMRQNMEAEVGDFLQRRGSGSREEDHNIQPARGLLATRGQTDR